MAKKYLIIFSFFVFSSAVFFAFPFYAVFAQSNTATQDVPINLQVIGACNNNGICERSLNEDENSCLADCGCNNNGVCEAGRGENIPNCPNDCAVSPPGGGGGGGGGGGIGSLQINLVASEITFQSAKITWATNRSAVCSFFLKESSEFKEEIFSGENYLTSHYVLLLDLSPGVTYNYDITCADYFGNKAAENNRSFTTLILPKVIFTANVTNLKLTQTGQDFTLTWKNPTDANFKGVKILKSEKYFPLSPSDGELIYDGAGNSFLDTAVENKKTYYYTVFAYDFLGDYSSGAVVSGSLRQATTPPPTTVTPPPTTVTPHPTITPTPVALNIKFNDFNFYINGLKVIPLNNTLKSIPGDKIHISIASTKIPDSVKAITITLQKGEESFSYLFSRQKGLFSTDFIAPEDGGEYSLTINFWGYDNEIIQKIEGKLEVSKITGIISNVCLSGVCIILWLIFILLIILLLLLIILRLLLLFRKKKKKKKPHK